MPVKLSLEALLTEAINLHRRGERAAALRTCQKLIGGLSEEALAELETSVSHHPDAGDLWHSLACAYGWLGEMERAEQGFGHVIALDPQNARAYLQRGHARLKLGNLDGARKDYEVARQLGIGAAIAKAYECLGLMYGKQKEYERSHQLLTQAVQLGRDGDALYFQLGWVCYHLKKWEEGLRFWSALRERHGQNPRLVALSNLLAVKSAAALVAERRWSEAASILKLVGENDASYLEAGPSELSEVNAEKRRLLGLALLRAGRLAELLQIDSVSNEILHYQAHGLYQAGRYDEAAFKLRRLLSGQPEAENARQLLADTLCQLANHCARRGQWENAGVALMEAFLYDAERRERLEWDAGLVKSAAGVYLLGGQLEEAADLWEEWQRSEVSDASAAHALLMIALRDAIERKESVALVRTDGAWQRAIRNAVLLLHDESFWKTWKNECEKRYGAVINEQAIRETKNRLEKQLMDQLPPTTSVGMDLRNEMSAARALEIVGGFPHPAEDLELVCGLRMLQHLGYTRPFSQFVRALVDERHSQTGDELGKLLRCFSRLGAAQALLDHGRPADALRALERACCESCATRAGTGENSIQVCQADCREFAHGNPAYAGLRNKGYLLWQDASRLAAKAHLALADDRVATAGMDLTLITGHLQAALHFAQLAEAGDAIQKTMADRVLGHAGALKNQSRLNDAAQLLETAHGLCREPMRSELGGRLAATLHSRGMEAANLPQPDWEAAVKDFRRAVELNPHIPAWLGNLAASLRHRAGEMMKQGPERPDPQPRLAAQLLLEARQALERGAKEFPDRLDEEHWTTQTTGLASEMEAVASWLNKGGVEKAERGKLEQGLEELWLAYNLAPQAPRTRENLCEATASYVFDLVDRRRLGLARETLERALREFPESESLRRAQSLVSR